MARSRNRKSSRTARLTPRRTRPAAPKKKAATVKPKASKRVYDAAVAQAIAKEVARWRKETLGPTVSKMPERRAQWVTDSGIPIPDILTAADRRAEEHAALGLPGEYPFTRGTQPTMYRGRLWTMRQ